MSPRYCYVDDCRKPATLILHSYPDDTLLCDDHRSLHTPGENGLRDEPCTLAGQGKCECVGDEWYCTAEATGLPYGHCLPTNQIHSSPCGWMP